MKFLKKIWKFISGIFSGNNKYKGINPDHPPAKPTNLLYTTRNDVDGPLTILTGTFPKDIYGEFYVIYPVGSVNSGGLPFPKTLPDGTRNPEYGTPIMNGDGYAVRISMNGEKPMLKARLLKTPSYYADYTSRYGTPYHDLFGFSNMGISRMSALLGSKNPLNTALTPFNTASSDTTLIAGYDVGRPYIIDPVSLDVISPVGRSEEWILASPDFLPWPFPFIQTTAHPSFDANTKELFIVNYSSHTYSLMNTLKRGQVPPEKHHHYKNKFLELLDEIKDEEIHKIRGKVLHFFHTHFGNKDAKLDDLMDPEKGHVLQLMRFTGAKNETMEKWLLHDQYGNPIVIKECMHQTALTKDYILLSDTSFKFSIDLLIQNFFPNSPEVERAIRKVLSKPMLPYTECYIVKRRELADGAGKAVAYKLTSPIPVETIHYSCDYQNPDGKITMYGMQNAAMCIAEWIRDYDISKITGAPVDENYISLFALGNMDISRVGKWVIDAETATIVEDESKEFIETGSIHEDNKGPNSWSIGLYAFPHMLSADVALDKIEKLWFVSNGLSNKTLTEFIYDMYKDYPNRQISVKEILKVTEQEMPSCMSRLDTATMTAEDYYQCDPYVYFRSIQYLPGKPGVPNDREFLFTTVQNGRIQPDGSVDYRGEYWIFDANNLAAGPVCTMHNPDVAFCFTLHSCWLPVAKSNSIDYKVDIDKDFATLINDLPERDQIEGFFRENIYPHFT